VKISVLTIFPDFFPAVVSEGMIRAAREKGRLEVAIVSLRDFTDDSHRTTDDYPFGGGAGMIMKVEPIDRALASLGVGEKGARPRGASVVLLSPQGRAFTQKVAIEFAALEHLVLVCGRYKGVDERVSEHLVDEELSVGDFVLSGGEPAALCVVDAIARLLPGVVSTFDSVESDSFHSGVLDAPYYTRPATYRGWSVPDVLLSGHHANIARARREESLRRTAERRPDLLAGAPLTPEDRRTLARLGIPRAVEMAPPAREAGERPAPAKVAARARRPKSTARPATARPAPKGQQKKSEPGKARPRAKPSRSAQAAARRETARPKR
jgi:tRNA (guanine37-N1)-methyltransferase